MSLSCDLKLWKLLDCLNLADCGVENLFIIVSVVLVVLVAKRWKNVTRLINEANSDSQNISQLKRNRRVHTLIMVYLLAFMLDLIMSEVIFWLVYKGNIGLPLLKNLTSAYLLLQQAHVYILDMIYITIAYIYGKAIICLGGIEQQHSLDNDIAEDRDTRFRCAKYVLIALGVVYLIAMIASIVVLSTEFGDYYNIVNIQSIVLTFVSTLFTVVLFSFFYKYAIKHLELSRSAKRRQFWIVMILSLSAVARCIINILFEVDLLDLRDYDQNNSCIDKHWTYSVFIFFFHVITNIIPIIAFLKVFSISQEQNMTEVTKTFEENTTVSLLIQ